MTHFMKLGSRFTVATDEAMDIRDELPVGTYAVKFNPDAGAFYFEIIDDFKLEGKIYGDTLQNSDRILNTFKERSVSTGVMLSGEKGSGKTLLAKKLSIDARAKGIPTVVVNQAWFGEIFNNFMQSVNQPLVVIFDEFEKVYEASEQEKLLTLLDGVYPSKKLFVITCNDRWRVNEHMRNRPGRLFYRIDYTGLDREFILEYCADNLKEQKNTDSVVRMSMMFHKFNFDILKAMVEEMNRYGETAQQVMKLLNAKPEVDAVQVYDAVLEVSDPESGVVTKVEEGWTGNPLSSSIYVNYAPEDAEPAPGDNDIDDDLWKMAVFSVENLKSIEEKTGKFLYVNEDGNKLSLVKRVSKSFDPAAF